MMKEVSMVMVVILCLFQMGYAIKCYEGIKGHTDTRNCLSSTSSCMKTVVGDHEESAIYNCAEIHVDDGCGVVLGTEICYCNTNLCNDSTVTSLTLSLLLVALLMKMML